MDHVDISEACYSQRVAEPGSASAFDVGEDFEPRRNLKTGIQRLNPRGGMFRFRPETVRTGIFRTERPLLADEIRLDRNPEPVQKRFSPGSTVAGASAP